MSMWPPIARLRAARRLLRLAVAALSLSACGSAPRESFDLSAGAHASASRAAVGRARSGARRQRARGVAAAASRTDRHPHRARRNRLSRRRAMGRPLDAAGASAPRLGPWARRRRGHAARRAGRRRAVDHHPKVRDRSGATGGGRRNRGADPRRQDGARTRRQSFPRRSAGAPTRTARRRSNLWKWRWTTSRVNWLAGRAGAYEMRRPRRASAQSQFAKGDRGAIVGRSWG